MVHNALRITSKLALTFAILIGALTSSAAVAARLSGIPVAASTTIYAVDPGLARILCSRKGGDGDTVCRAYAFDSAGAWS